MKPIDATVRLVVPSVRSELLFRGTARGGRVLFISAMTVLLVGVQGCMLVMDTDFGKYYEQEQQGEPAQDGGLPPVEAGTDSSPDVGPVDAAPPDDATTGHDVRSDNAVSGTCFDHIKNQNETGVDCGGVCKPCEPVGFVHRENFNTAPSGWGPDGEYIAAGICDDNAAVDGWVIYDEVPSGFTKASGRFATISTLDQVLVGCDDVMASPKLQTKGATTISVDFDNNFRVDLDFVASVWFVRDQ